LDYDEVIEIVLGWDGCDVLLLCSFDMPCIGFQDRPFLGRLREGGMPLELRTRVGANGSRINGEVARTSEHVRHFSLWSVAPSFEAPGRQLLGFSLARRTFSEGAWGQTGGSGKELMIRHGMFRWIICPHG
jgi:hypothetical protein